MLGVPKSSALAEPARVLALVGRRWASARNKVGMGLGGTGKPPIGGATRIAARTIAHTRAFSLNRPGQVPDRITEPWPEPVDTDSDKPRLFLGKLPTDLPAEIPVPEGMVLLGGLRRKSPWRGETDAQVILEAGVKPEGVYSAFREHLAGSEWSEKRRPLAERGGFVSTGSGMRSLTFCLSPRGPALSVSAYRRRGAGTTEVRLRLEGSRRDSPCSDDHDRYRYDERSVIPALFPPAGVAQISGGGGSGSDSEENYAHLRTGMPPAALVEHYSAQLEEAGWSWAGGGQEGPTAWSGWTFEDEDGVWVGTFVAMSPPGPSEVRFVQVSASAVPEDLR